MSEWNKLSCDVLVIGGGIGGLSCATAIKEHNPDADVLVVEKNFAGYAGKANRGGGVLQYFDLEKIDPKEFVAYHTEKIGAWFTDQELMEKYVSMNTYMLDKLLEWGANLPKVNGKFMVMPTGPMTAMIQVDLDVTLKVRRTAEKKGVRFLDKTVMADLITADGAVVGATVFSVLDGSYSAISAKKVVLATGSQNYRMGSMWSNGRGDGIKAAYKAGAELRNAEFGNFAQLVKVKSHNEVVFGENYMYNANGEHISENFLKGGRETDINSTAIREWYLQMQEGNGPVHLEMGSPFGGPPMGAGGPPMGAGGPPMGAGGPPMGAGGPPMGAGGPPMGAGGPPMGAGGPPMGAGGPPMGAGGPPMGGGPRDAGGAGGPGAFAGQPYAQRFRALNDGSGDKVDTDMEVCPMLIGEQSCIRVDHHMKTTLDGLYAIGDCSYCGSGLAGAVPAPPGRNRGSGILNAVFAALQCAEEIGHADLSGAAAPLCDEQTQATIDHMKEFLDRKDGVKAEDVIALVQEAMVPMEQSVYMKADRMAKALEIVYKAKALLPKLMAADMHEAMKCLEAEAMVLSAELHYRTSDLRKESRGWFLREDYPNMDNLDWLKWIIVKNVDGEMTFRLEDLPMDKWAFKPKPMVPITEEEKQGPLYKYFIRPLAEPAPEKYNMAEKPSDPALGLMAEDMNKLFDPGYLPMEVGYCQLPNGCAVLANLTFMPGVTPEMFDFWFAWHGVEAMRYKIWDHDDHYFVQTQNMEKALDKSLSLKERYWDTTHHVEEDCNMGKQTIFINFRNPADIGFDPEKLASFGGTIVCSGGEQAPTIMVHFVRPVPGGSELRTRFFMGYNVVDGKPHKMIPDGMKMPLEPVQALLKHNIKEFANLAAILPEVYAEFIDDFTK